jgi:hypothetical protein
MLQTICPKRFHCTSYVMQSLKKFEIILGLQKYTITATANHKGNASKTTDVMNTLCGRCVYMPTFHLRKYITI